MNRLNFNLLSCFLESLVTVGRGCISIVYFFVIPEGRGRLQDYYHILKDYGYI